ncbi:hypothetical protein LMG28614_03061 [Paraburkholderia ultramafica]|uniref:Uncharacterized protein n=1 Tax=Paraburkholderia ultramafica TaxID=1544867 RepID=A0A6S7BJ75_9BURK|nr:hypothetical protein [Paraburkholderia ultramafica]CAB3790398.1 hypothetical protein LMG28614_03061 [Paraburkholderia ultramafica]
MARPIGIFGALMALGGFLAVRYVQHRRAVQVPSARELSRWEDEGGAVATPAGNVPVESVGPGAHGGNGSAQANGDSRAWPFPHS